MRGTASSPEAGAERTACLECDLLVDVALDDGERASCPRCGHMLSSRPVAGLSRSLAFATGALVLLVLANSFPFLELRSSGLEHMMTLPRTAIELSSGGQTTIAVLVFGPIVVVPAVMTIAILSLLLPLAFEVRVPWLVPIARVFTWLNTWAMVEVFVIGVLVSLVKISDLATVIPGFSFWAYLAFSLCFIAAVSGIDRLQLWQEIEAVGS